MIEQKIDDAQTAANPSKSKDSIEREAAALDAELGAVEDGHAPPGAGTVQQAPSETLVQENQAIFESIVTMLTPALPFLAQCYPKPVVEGIARAYTAVEVKRGWSLSGMLSAEGALAMVALPPTVMAIAMGREHFARLRQQRERELEARARAQYGQPPPPEPPPATDPQSGTYRVF